MEQEIEITPEMIPEMIAAGVFWIFLWDSEERKPSDLAIAIFRAMRAVEAKDQVQP
jgi:hypothetical protein